MGETLAPTDGTATAAALNKVGRAYVDSLSSGFRIALSTVSHDTETWNKKDDLSVTRLGLGKAIVQLS